MSGTSTASELQRLIQSSSEVSGETTPFNCTDEFNPPGLDRWGIGEITTGAAETTRNSPSEALGPGSGADLHLPRASRGEGTGCPSRKAVAVPNEGGVTYHA